MTSVTAGEIGEKHPEEVRIEASREVDTLPERRCPVL